MPQTERKSARVQCAVQSVPPYVGPCNLFAANLFGRWLASVAAHSEMRFMTRATRYTRPRPVPRIALECLGVLPIWRLQLCNLCDCLLSTKWFLCRWWCNSLWRSTVCSAAILYMLNICINRCSSVSPHTLTHTCVLMWVCALFCLLFSHIPFA